MDYRDYTDDSIFVFVKYGKAIAKSKTPFAITCNNIHLWDSNRDQDKFIKTSILDPMSIWLSVPQLS
jgi:hypothetical protein